MQCPKCKQSIKVNDIAEKQMKYGFMSQFTCPHCNAALGLSANLFILMLIGFLLILTGSIFAMVQPGNIIYSAVAFCGALVAYFSSIKNKPKILN